MPDLPIDQPVLLTPIQLSKYLGVSRSTIWRAIRLDANFPKPFKIMSLPRWQKSIIDEWINTEGLNHGEIRDLQVA